MTGTVGLILFESTNVALRTESALKAAGIPTTVIPTPVEFTSECGIALLVNDLRLEAAQETLESVDINGYRLVFPYERGGDAAPGENPGR